MRLRVVIDAAILMSTDDERWENCRYCMYFTTTADLSDMYLLDCM